MEICLDETDTWMESCEMGSENASGNKGFIVKTLGQSNV
jgi:hypothetical protein